MTEAQQYQHFMPLEQEKAEGVAILDKLLIIIVPEGIPCSRGVMA